MASAIALNANHTSGLYRNLGAPVSVRQLVRLACANLILHSDSRSAFNRW